MARPIPRSRNVGVPIPNNPFNVGETSRTDILLETSSGSVVIPGASVVNDRLVIEAQSMVTGGFDFGTF